MRRMGWLLAAVLMVGCNGGPVQQVSPTQAPQSTRAQSEGNRPESHREEKRERREERREERGDSENMPGAEASTSAGVNTGQSEGRLQRRGNHAAANSTPGSFDYYLLNLSWSPEFCATHAGKPECAARPRFVLHGLWPENADGSYPEHCSNAPGPSNPGQYADLYPDQGLLAHEWETHGTCSGLGPDAFFQAARRAFKAVAIPAALAGDTTQLRLAPVDIVNGFVKANRGLTAEDVVVSCGNNQLTAVEVCVSKNLAPVSCQGVRTCRANVVTVTPPGS